MSTNPIGAELAIKEAVREKINSLPLDRLIGHPTIKTWQHLREQCCQIAAQVKTTHWGGQFGHLALVLNDNELQTATGDPNARSDRQTKPPYVHPQITATSTHQERAQLTAAQNIKLTAYFQQEAVDEYLVERIVQEVVDTQYVADLKNKYTGYANQTIKSVLTHLKVEWVQITTKDKTEAKAAFAQPWDMTSELSEFIRLLNERADFCTLLEMTDITDESKVQVLVENMYASDMFTEDEMNDWEIAVSKDWADATSYFLKHYKKKCTFNLQRASRRQGYDSANSITETATEAHFNNKPSSDASLPGTVMTTPSSMTTNTGMTLDEQQTLVKYTESLEEKLNERETEFAGAMSTTQTNFMEQLQQQQKMMMDQQQQFMQTMMEKLLTQNNTRTGGTGGGGNFTRTGPTCPHCGKKGKHAKTPDKCLSLEKNKDQRPPGWKV